MINIHSNVVRRYVPIVLSCVILAACDTAEEDLQRVGHDIHRNYDDTRYKVSKWFYDEPEPVRYTQPQPASFCYSVLMDVVCYDAPQPDLHINLVSVQGAHAYGYDDFLPDNVLRERYTTMPQQQQVTMHDTMQSTDMPQQPYQPAMGSHIPDAHTPVPQKLMGR